VVATDERGDVLLKITGQKINELARANQELKSFDFFSPKTRNGVTVFRGVDFENRKALYVHHKNRIQKILTQGDTVLTDQGLGRIQYPNEHSIFYGAAGVGPQGEILQQVTLTDPDHPRTLMGVGLVILERE
jgi:hypothetical protein